MSEAIWIAITVLLGVGQALQVSLLGAVNRARGPSEAAYLSILGTVAGLSLVLTVRGMLSARPALPPPLDHPATTGAVALLTSVLLVAVVRGLPGAYAITGIIAVPYLIAASYLAPRIGVGLFLTALIAGQLGGGVALDHLGAFGAAARPVDAVRVAGIAALLAGVILVRGFR